METVQTYKFYTEDGRRIGAIGEVVDGNKLRVFLLFCSKQDNFVKKRVKTAYREWKDLVSNEFHPVVFDIPFEQGTNPAWVLIDYMENNYYRKSRVGMGEIIAFDVLYSNDTMIALGNIKMNKSKVKML